MNKRNIFLLLMVVFSLIITLNVRAASIEVDTLEQLKDALNDSNYDEIVLTQLIDITEDTIIDGHNKLVRATFQGVDEHGIIQSAPSYALFNIPNFKKLSISNMKIKGSGKRPFEVDSIGTLVLENVSISNTGNKISTGGAIYNLGTTYLKNVNLNHNVANLAGAIFNSGKLIIDGAVIYENRNIGGGSKGGGAIENSGTAYINNAIFANNYSTEIGGAINNNGGNLYIMNSTFTGNVSESWYDYYGGGIGVNNGKVTIINSVINNNYHLRNDVLTPSDIGMYSGNNVTIINSIVEKVLHKYNHLTETNIEVKNVSENVFAKTAPGHLVTKENEIVSYEGYLRPGIIVNGYSANIYSKKNGETFTGGVYTFFDYNIDTKKAIMCYGETNDATLATCILGTSALQSHLITKFVDGTNRDILVIGASGSSDIDYYNLTIAPSEHGYVLNGNLFGIFYEKDSIVTLEPVADTGYFLQYWEYKDGDKWKAYSRKDPLNIKMNKDIILRPVFGTVIKYLTFFDSSISSDITSDIDNYEVNDMVQLDYDFDKYDIKIINEVSGEDVTEEVSFDFNTKTFVMPNYDVLITGIKKKYAVTVEENISGSVNVIASEFEFGTKVKLDYDINKYDIKIINKNSEEDVTEEVSFDLDTKTFIMPVYDVLITGVKKKYTVTIESSIFDIVSVKANEYEVDAMVQLDYDADKYDVKIMNADSGEDVTKKVTFDLATKTFVMPGCNVKITATKIPENGLEQIPEEVLEQIPQTLDNISCYIALGSISLIGLLCTGLYLRKKMN